MTARPRAYCGIDWAEGHHDLALVDGDGTLIAKRRIRDNAQGFTELIALLAEAGDDPEDRKAKAGELIELLARAGR